MNNNILTDGIRLDGEYKELLKVLKRVSVSANPQPILLTGLCEGAADAAYASLIEDVFCLSASKKVPVLLVCAEEKECVRLKIFLEQYGIRVGFFVGRDLTLYNITASHEYEHERLKVLSGILGGEYDAIVTTPDAALEYTMPPDVLSKNRIRLEYSNSSVDVNSLSAQLVSAGFSRVEMVEGAGQFAIRGGIIDIYPPFSSYKDIDGNEGGGSVAIRVELFGDEIDRMELFDPQTQRMTLTLDEIEIFPSREVLVDSEKRAKIRQTISSHSAKCKDERALLEMAAEIAAIDGGMEINFADKYMTLIYPERTSLLDYLNGTPAVFIRNSSAINDRAKAFEWHMNQTVTELLEGGTIAPKYTDYAKPRAMLDVFVASRPSLYFDSLAQGMNGRKLAGMFNFRTKHMVSYGDNFALLFEDIEAYKRGGYRVVVTAENETSAKNICGLLCDKGINAVVEAADGEFTAENLPRNVVIVVWRRFVKGYELTAARLAIFSTNPESRDGALSAASKLKRSHKKKKGTQTILSYNDLSVGDYVVHENYGIGQYMGIRNLTVDGVSRDYIDIHYAGSDKLLLPTDKLDMVSKYIGAHSDDGLVKLSKFSTGEWGRTKAKTKALVKDMAKELIKLYAERARREGFAFPPDDELQRDFEAAFDYDETDAQLDAIEDIKEDMMKPTPMDRLLCGDVGFGKTEVALRAAYKAVLGGKQVAILVPTTILALQHYQTIASRMRAFSVNVDMVSRFRTQKQQALTLRALKRGDVDIIVGTHRLISKDIEFKDLGLLIIDEEQRFGVAQKEKLKKLGGNIDVLTLTATPIPRTLNMAMGGIRDISILDEAPGDRLPVQTYVLEYDELIIFEAMRRELRRGGQIFYLHNFVDSIDGCAARIAKEIPEARITVAHGKMDKEQLEDIWEEMLTGKIDILVCTTIIETGIDIPNANTLIVDSAHRLGLSQLHQIRGRVGRSARRAYAYFTYPKDKTVTDIATKRLEAIREYAEFGAGFKIALRDMEIRGVGNLLGAEQHGHLDAVGYDLYIKLLNEAVLEEKGEAVKPRIDCTVSLKCDAFIPEAYVPYSSQRMGLYKRMANISTPEDKDDILDELIDRYGNVPKATMNLLNIALVRSVAMKCGVSSIVEDSTEVRIYPEEFDLEVWSTLSDILKNRLRVVMGEKVSVAFRFSKQEDLPALMYKLFVKYLECQKEIYSQNVDKADQK